MRHILQDVEFKLMASLNILNILQSIVMFAGMATGLALCTKARSCQCALPIPTSSTPPPMPVLCSAQHTCHCILAACCDALYYGWGCLGGVLVSYHHDTTPAQGVGDGSQTVGDVALFLSLLAQLFAPLNWSVCMCGFVMRARDVWCVQRRLFDRVTQSTCDPVNM